MFQYHIECHGMTSSVMNTTRTVRPSGVQGAGMVLVGGVLTMLIFISDVN